MTDPLADTADNGCPHVLVVDDEPELRSLLSTYLGRNGMDVSVAENAAQARAHVAQRVPAMVVLDVNMPGENGLSLARWLRETHPAMGILMLTSLADSVDRIVGLELGADDYVPKPFELRELLARVRALLRRSQRPVVAAPSAEHVATGQRVRFHGFVLEPQQRRLTDPAGVEVVLTAAEFDLLALLVRQPNRPLTRDQIMEHAHHRGWEVFDRSIDLRVMRLRRKIERNPNHPQIIKTVRNVGYVFTP